MSMLTCGKCHYVWDGGLSPFCPMCAIKKYETDPRFFRRKHDPTELPYPMKDFRSVLSMDFVVNKSLYIYTLATQGVYYFDTYNNNFTCVVNQPLGIIAGSAIPSWFPLPTYPMDSQIIADVWGSPHVFAENNSTINFRVNKGRLIPPRLCDMVGCANLAIPGTNRCVRH